MAAWRRTLIEPLEAQIKGGKSRIQIVRVLDSLDNDPEWVLVSSNERRAAHPDVFKMNVMNGRTSSCSVILEILWAGSPTGMENVIGAGFTEELETGFMLLKDEEKDEWETITRVRFDEASFSPAGITGDGENGYVISNLTPEGKKRDKAALYKYNFKTKTLGELVYEHAEIDCCGLIQN